MYVQYKTTTLLNHLSPRVVIEEYCIRSRMALVVKDLVTRSRLSDIFDRSGFPRSEEGFPLEVSARPSDVSLDERLRRLLILGSTRMIEMVQRYRACP